MFEKFKTSLRLVIAVVTGAAAFSALGYLTEGIGVAFGGH